MKNAVNTKNSKFKVFSTWKKVDNLGIPIFEFNRFKNSNVESLLDLFSSMPLKSNPYYKKRNRLRSQAALKLSNTQIFTKETDAWVLGYSNNEKKGLKDSHRLKALSFEQLKENCANSVIFSQLNTDNLILNKIANDLSQKYKCYVGINGYFTPSKSKTFPRHFDHHDVFIFQLSGSKSWKVFDYSANSAGKLKPIIEIILQPGDFMFIPAGYYHEAKTENSASFHLTFGLHDVPIYELKQWISKKFPKLKNWNINEKSIYNYKLLYYLKNNTVFKKTRKVFSFENKKLKQLVVFSKDLQIQLPLNEKKSLENYLKGNTPKTYTEKRLNELLEVK